ncbi:MAG: XdhC family protein [Chitinophagales bacterium]
MFHQFIDTTQKLYQNKEPFAIAFVVSREIPSSGKPGDKAVITKDGTITGWIGGGCTKGIVLKEALDAIKDGKPRLVKISPDGQVESKAGVMCYPMVCHSGGAVELYIEPVLPKPQLLIMGKSNVAMALARLGKGMDYPVVVAAKSVDSEGFEGVNRIIEGELKVSDVNANTCIVVCTQGENDEDALEQALQSNAEYVSFVASRRKASAIFHTLRQRGIPLEQLERVKSPAGLNINAKLPEEVAISILAEIVQFIREERVEISTSKNDVSSDLFINPVCNVPVQKSSAKHVINFNEKDYYFCCDGCKVAFEREPEKYALTD